MDWSITSVFLIDFNVSPSNHQTNMGSCAWAGNKTFYARQRISEEKISWVSHFHRPSLDIVISAYPLFSLFWQVGYEVPRVHLLCEEPKIIGTPFYVMSFVEVADSPAKWTFLAVWAHIGRGKNTDCSA